MTKTSKLALAAAGIAATMACSTSALAQSADALIDKLVDKGVLSVKEANELRAEADKNFTQAYSVKSGMPEWVQALKISGDFRGRYEGFFADNPAFEDRNRFRYRARFGVTAVMSDSFEVGLRLASGDIDSASGLSSGVDPISSNQSFQNNGSKKGIFIDQAYGKWTPINNPDWSVATTIGKMENPYLFSDLVFDSDYTPEGAAVQIGRNLGEKHVVKVNSGAFVLDEVGATTQDPFMFGAQARLESIWTPELSTSLGASYLAIMNPEQLGNGTVPNINVGNTRDGAGNLVYDYAPVVLDASATYKLESFPMYAGAFPIKVGGDYIYNDGASGAADNEGWSAGITFGKAGKRKTWEVSYTYKWLGADAWWEEVVDSDSGAFYSTAYPGAGAGQGVGYRSGTNVKGHVMRVAYSPYDTITVSAKAFLMERIDVPADSEMTRLQVDAQWKF